MDWSLSVDSTIARAHQHAANTKRLIGAGSNCRNLALEPLDQAVGRSRGGLPTKIHQRVDDGGLPLVALPSAGQAGDSLAFLPLMHHLRVARQGPAPDATRRGPGDKAYSSLAICAHLRSRGIRAVIPEPSDQQGHRRRRGSRDGRPVGLDYKNRSIIERRFCHIKQWRCLATRYDILAIVYRAAVILNAVTAGTRQLSDTP